MKNKHNDIYELFNREIEKHPELYVGLKEAISSPQFATAMEEFENGFRNEYKEDPTLKDDFGWEEDEYVGLMVDDFNSFKILDVWGNQFIDNLLKAGFKYNPDDECWTLPNESYMDPIFKDMVVTNYGLIWLLW